MQTEAQKTKWFPRTAKRHEIRTCEHCGQERVELTPAAENLLFDLAPEMLSELRFLLDCVEERERWDGEVVAEIREYGSAVERIRALVSRMETP